MRPFAARDIVNVVIETSAGSRNPYDLGFVLGTNADDGDPLDALVLSDEPLAVGSYIACRVLGAFEATTDGERKDRLIVVPRASIRGVNWHRLADLGEQLVREIAEFLASYVKRKGREFELIRRVDRPLALKLVEEARG